LKRSIDDLVKLAAELSEKFSSSGVTFKASCEASTELIAELNHPFFQRSCGEASSEARNSAQSGAGLFLLLVKLGMKLLAKL